MQFRSNQPIKSTTAEDMGDLTLTDPDTFQDLFTKKIEDPVFMPKPGCSVWNSITTLPNDKLKLVVRPNTLRKDQECAESIIKKINEDQVAEKIQQAWKVRGRLETRARLMRQKEKNIKAELAGGVKKNYQPIGVSLIEKSIASRFRTLNSGSQQVSQTQSVERNNNEN